MTCTTTCTTGTSSCSSACPLSSSEHVPHVCRSRFSLSSSCRCSSFLFFVLILKSLRHRLQGCRLQGAEEEVREQMIGRSAGADDQTEVEMRVGCLVWELVNRGPVRVPGYSAVQEAGRQHGSRTVVSEVSGLRRSSSTTRRRATRSGRVPPPRVCDCCGVMNGKASATGASPLICSCLNTVGDLLAKFSRPAKACSGGSTCAQRSQARGFEKQARNLGPVLRGHSR